MSDTRDFRLVASNDSARPSHDFNKMRINGKVFKDDVTLNIKDKDLKRKHRRIKREDINRAIERMDVKSLREISNYYFLKSGIYSRLCRYMANLYRYDWMVTPIRYDNKIKDEKVIEG